MISANDVMTPNPTTISGNMDIKEAIRLLVERNVTGLPVVDEEERLLGIITEKDILNALYHKNIKNKKAFDLMTRDVVSFDVSDNIMDIFRVLTENNFRRVPILSDGKLVGIISRKDIIKFLSKRPTKE